MSAFIDTNIIVRHLTGDPPEMAQRATRFLASERELLLTDLVADAALLLRAVEVYETDCLDFAEAYSIACAESTEVRRVASFDRSIDRVNTIERIEPPVV